MKLKGSVIVEGIGFGHVLFYEQKQYKIQHEKFSQDDYDAHISIYQDAFLKTKEDLERLKQNVVEISNEQSEIFNAHLEILQDPEVIKTIDTLIHDGLHPTKAIFLAYQGFIDLMNQLDNPFMKARSLDIEDVKTRLLSHIIDNSNPKAHFIEKPAILIAHELFPSDIATLDKTHIKGIITEKGSKFSHVSIMIRSLGIPYIVGVTNVQKLFNQDAWIILDTMRAEIHINPDDSITKSYTEKIDISNQSQSNAESYVDIQPITKDHHEMHISLNVNDMNDPSLTFLPYASGIGLLRTEFIFLNRLNMPDEESQYQMYVELLKMSKGKPLVIRTLDIGGDKLLPYYPLGKEDNPFLGKRGIRLTLEEKNLMNPQIRAILRANDGSMRLMFPMVTHIEEVKKLKDIVLDLSITLKHEGYDIQPIQFGVMIEVPSLVYMIDELMPYIDFASIGTNDLIQYLTAMDRLNPDLISHYQTYPKVLFKVLKDLQDSFTKYDKPLSICGEIASDPTVTEVLIGLGYQQLSVSYQAMKEVKNVISQTSLTQSQKLALEVLKAETEQDIIKILKESKHT